MRIQRRNSNRINLLVIVICILSIQTIYGQKNTIVGKYENFSSYNNVLYLNIDSTFNFISSFSILGTYANGIWTVCNDTIHLKVIFKEKRPKTLNWEYLNLSVSSDKRSIIYTKELITFPYESDIGLPSQLFYKNKRLYAVDRDGRVNKNLCYKKEK